MEVFLSSRDRDDFGAGLVDEGVPDGNSINILTKGTTFRRDDSILYTDFRRKSIVIY